MSKKALPKRGRPVIGAGRVAANLSLEKEHVQALDAIARLHDVSRAEAANMVFMAAKKAGIFSQLLVSK